jgi:predicted O-methyltransferase YrrM
MKAPKFYRIFDYDKDLLPNEYVARMDSATNIEDAKTKTGFTIGYPGWGIIYHLLLGALSPTNKNVIIETGTNWGMSTVFLAQALKDSGREGTVHTIEIEEENFEKAKQTFVEAEVGNYIKQYLGDSKAILPQVLDSVDLVDVAFLDGSHLYQDVMTEFELSLPRLKSNSIVIFDNTYEIAEQGEDPRVNGALKEIQKVHGGNLINLEHVSWYTPGLAIWQKSPF